MARLALVLTVLATLAGIQNASRADNPPQPIGKIAILVSDSAYVTITERGEPKTYMVGDACKITLDGRAAKLSDLRNGHYVLSVQVKEKTDPPELTEFVLASHSAVQPEVRPTLTPTASPNPNPSPNPSPNPAPKARRQTRIWTNTPMDGALNKVEMTDETWEAANTLLKTWKETSDAEVKSLNEKRRALEAAAQKETDPDKKREAFKQLREFKMPGPSENYAAIRQALKGTLSEEQLAKVDEVATERLARQVEQYVRSMVNQLEKPAGGFDKDQKAQMETAFKSVRERAGKMALTTLLTEQYRFGTAAVTDIRDTIFTEQQRQNIRQPRKPPTQPG
ncbi:MAG: hypothetical protein PHU85_10690 [Phycisphaerae bacterium]|nr:hypothetical protein [Phycisphaerae bacterium]